jgi:hypothetical protein
MVSPALHGTTTSGDPARSDLSSSRAWRPGRRPIALLAVQVVVGISAVGGGIGLIVHGLGIPRAELAGTPFDTFLIPGFILAFVVGGSLLAAAWSVWMRRPGAPLASLAAGGILLGWIVIETAMIESGRDLQATVLVLALLEIGLASRYRRGATRS